MDNYNYLYKTVQKYVSTYQFLPKDNVPYPFAVINNTNYDFTEVKTTGYFNTLKRENYQVDFYYSSKKMSELKKTINNILEILQPKINMNKTNVDIILDDSTDELLWHGILEVEFYGS